MKRLLALLLSLGLAQPLALSGQLAPIPGAQEYLDFVGKGPAVLATWGNVYIGPYAAQFTTGAGGSPTSPQFSIYCVDYSHFASDQRVNSSTLGSGQSDAGLGNTRLGANAGSLEAYTAAAYYSSLFDSWSVLSAQYGGASRRTVWSAIHAAVWHAMSGGRTDLGSGATKAIRDDLLGFTDINPQYAAAASSYSANGWYVLSPARGYDGQEFLIRTNVVPEPSTYILMGTGLLLLLAFGRKRMGSLIETKDA